MTEREINADMERALKCLKEGGIILYPTDTIWGIGCDATDSAAVERIFALKRRPGSKAMISLVASLGQLSEYVDDVPEEAKKLMEETSTPLTVIYSNPKGISSALKAEDGSAAFRITGNEFTAKLCAMLGRPLVSTSANIAGQPSAAVFSEINEDIKAGVDYICEFGRNLRAGSPSRIVKFESDGRKTVIR